MKKRIGMALTIALVVASLAGCGNDSAKNTLETEVENTVQESSAVSEETEAAAGSGETMETDGNTETVDLTPYDGAVYQEGDSKITMTLRDLISEKALEADFEIDPNGEVSYLGIVTLKDSDAFADNGVIHFRGVRSYKEDADVDVDINSDGTLTYAITMDDGNYLSSTLTCPELSGSNESVQASGNLADYIGGYKASNGDSFTIEDREGVVRLYDLDLSSIDGWQGKDGGYPLDQNMEDGVFTVYIVTQNSAADGTVKIHGDGTIDMELSNVNTSKGASDYNNTFSKTSEDVTDTSNEVLQVFTEGRIDCKEDNKLFINFGTMEKGYYLRFLAFDASSDIKEQFSDENLSFKDSDLSDGTGGVKTVQCKGSKHEDCTYSLEFDPSAKTIAVTVTTGSGDKIVKNFVLK